MQSPPWYRIHVVTCLMVLIVGAALLWIQVENCRVAELAISSAYGWPLACKQYDYLNRPELPELHWLIAFAVNATTSIV